MKGTSAKVALCSLIIIGNLAPRTARPVCVVGDLMVGATVLYVVVGVIPTGVGRRNPTLPAPLVQLYSSCNPPIIPFSQTKCSMRTRQVDLTENTMLAISHVSFTAGSLHFTQSRNCSETYLKPMGSLFVPKNRNRPFYLGKSPRSGEEKFQPQQPCPTIIPVWLHGSLIFN